MPPVILPMLAHPLRDKDKIDAGWFAQIKYNGWRLVVRVAETPLIPNGGCQAGCDHRHRSVEAWTRTGKAFIFGDKAPHLIASLCRLPPGVYDG